MVRQIGQARREVVEKFTEHLIAAYEDFLRRSPEPILYADGLMAAHNFHKRIVLDLEHRLDDDTGAIRQAAVDTFTVALHKKEVQP